MLRTAPFHLLLASIAAAQADLTIPKGWSLEKQPPLLIVRPDPARAKDDVRVEIDDPATANVDLLVWTRERVMKLPADVSRGCKLKLDRASEASCTLTASDGMHFLYGFRTKAGEYRLVHVVTPNALVAIRYARAVQSLMDGAEEGRGRSGVAPLAPVPLVAPVPETAAVTTAPAPVSGFRRVSRVPLESLYLHLEYRMGVGGAIYPTYEPYVLLKDGTVTDDLSFYPQTDEEIAEWRRRKPRAWGRWTLKGSQVEILWNDARRKPETWNKWFVARPGAIGSKLQGRFQSLGGGGNTALGGDVQVVAWSGYEFLPDGRVTIGGGAGASNGGGGTGVSVATGSRRAEQTARYRVDGYSLELEFEDGRRLSHWFYLYPDSDRAIGIGDSTYTLKK